MLALLRLEIIGEERPAMRRMWKRLHSTDRAGRELRRTLFPEPWVARLSPGFQREFLEARRDYQQANDLGTRGVFCVFWLEDGVYEVSERVSATQERRYFIRAHSGTYTRISREEVEQWLNAASASTF